jgi:FMN hydrolase / 5-amino-6-(5-phospho-D-ribitylamino)uracil phosphatase
VTNHSDVLRGGPPATGTDRGLAVWRVRAITLDLDDTLWPIWPTIARAESALLAWLGTHAPAAANLCASPTALRDARNHTVARRPDLAHDMSGLRRESIRHLLERAGEETALAEPAFDVFFAERHRVELFADALPALRWLSSRYPVVAVTNGNADVHRVGIGAHFRGSFHAHQFGVAKPHPAIFRAAAQSAGVAPEEVLHIGDDPHLDGVGALNAGMQMAWVNRSGMAWEHAPLAPHITVADLTTLVRALAAQPAAAGP